MIPKKNLVEMKVKLKEECDKDIDEFFKQIYRKAYWSLETILEYEEEIIQEEKRLIKK